ncbi:hypothetical protein PRK78_000034 [Emydomyces testavorans]|uniref:Aminoglycoside phosphotransferase domain-containing protein n=1 Tax=Emydomyces testavorans TaxID=2070801 RepID=A0AAF0IHB2_9EURO|nr:hypothetical protein PRK78_000034 [Emydomyces testavorans]
MVITITCDADMPKCLNTPTKQAKKAKLLAELHSGIPAKKASGPGIQGFFSRTMIVTLKNKEELVIQFRPEPLDIEPFKVARESLGAVVPTIELLEDDELKSEGIWTYCMNRLPGEPWLRAGGKRLPIVRSLARILSKGWVKDGGGDVVENKLRPHLELLLSSPPETATPYKDVARDLLGKLEQLKRLPLFISHYDLNEVNILVRDGEVSGLVDWEFSSPLPFGVGFGRIHTLAGEFSQGEFYMPDDFVETETAFWQEVFDGVPAEVKVVLDANVDAIQTAVTLGKLLEVFELMDGEIGSGGAASLKALPKFLSYRIPAIRGSDPPYAK